MATDASAAVAEVYREDWGRIVAALIRLLGDFDLAEEAAQEAFSAAVEQWPREGIPDLPRAWIIRTARNKAIDRLRRQARFEEKQGELVAATPLVDSTPYAIAEEGEITDDRLRLVFTCCHPAIGLEAQVALTLRVLCGLTTEEIARAFLVPVATMAQRLVRVKHKIREAGIPYRVPSAEDLPERLDAVLTVIYLVFNEGHTATLGSALMRRQLCSEAIRLARLLRTLMSPPPGELGALLALMLLHDSRRDARLDGEGDLVVLEKQDRTRWDQKQIAEALPLVEAALRETLGPFTLQAAIAALHCQARRPEETDWPQIVRLYELQQQLQPSPIVALNHAVAVAMAQGPAAGLALINELSSRGDLDNYHLLYAAKADLLRRLGAQEEAADNYRQAMSMTANESEKRYLARRLSDLTHSSL